MDTTLTIVGNLTSEPELRFTSSGVAVAGFTVASTPRVFDKQANEWRDGETLFMRCTVWRQTAENAAESLQKGTRVIVRGKLQQRSFETREGEKRSVMEMLVDEVGPSLWRATAKVQRAAAPQQTPQAGTPQWGTPADQKQSIPLDPWSQGPAKVVPF